ncbi:MAG TPA: DUF4350 domain-containing protein [Polyangiaceae bacterium]|nr:DUF4350 domain-containing protein [Polyangiaceae bacterium]
MTRLGIFLCVITTLVGLARGALAGPFEVRDTGWEGCSELFEIARTELGEGRVVVLSELDWRLVRPEDGLLILHPTRALSSDRLSKFLRSGGRVAIVDDFGAGSRILEHFGIERVPIPSRPIAMLRHNADLAIAEPVREPLEGRGEQVHPTVENVERLVTNHPTGLRHPKMGPVLKIRGIDEPDVVLALAGELDEVRLGKLFAMGDPSALINQMLRYPGNRAFASGLIHYLAPDLGDARGGNARGRLLVLANDFTETGVSEGGLGDLVSEIDGRFETATRELRRLFQGGLTGLVGVVAAAIVALGVGLWTTSVASRTYQRKVPSFARSIGALSHGGAAGRVAVLSAPSTPYALVALELKNALEEGIAHALGFAANLPPPQLLAEIAKSGALDERRQRTVKSALLEMAHIETLVAAGQAQTLRKSDATRLAAIVFDVLQAVRAAVRERPAA